MSTGRLRNINSTGADYQKRRKRKSSDEQDDALEGLGGLYWFSDDEDASNGLRLSTTEIVMPRKAKPFTSNGDGQPDYELLVSPNDSVNSGNGWWIGMSTVYIGEVVRMDRPIQKREYDEDWEVYHAKQTEMTKVN